MKVVTVVTLATVVTVVTVVTVETVVTVVTVVTKKRFSPQKKIPKKTFFSLLKNLKSDKTQKLKM